MKSADSRQSPDGRLAERARTLFDKSVDDLDAATVSQLNRNRHDALARARRRRMVFGWPALLPASAVAAAAVVAVLISTGDGNGLQPVQSEAATDLELLLENEELEMLEDLEFYSWIDFEEESAAHVG